MTPTELKADVSTEIVFRYLDRPEFHEAVGAATNNHFDEDGLLGLYAILEPEQAQSARAMITDVATAGDFGKYHSRDAARVAMTISAYADPDLSPLDQTIFRSEHSAKAAAMYRALLPRVPAMLSDIHEFQRFSSEKDQILENSLAALKSGAIAIEETPNSISASSESQPRFRRCACTGIRRASGGRWRVQASQINRSREATWIRDSKFLRDCGCPVINNPSGPSSGEPSSARSQGRPRRVGQILLGRDQGFRLQLILRHPCPTLLDVEYPSPAHHIRRAHPQCQVFQRSQLS